MTRQIRMSRGYVAVVDDADYAAVVAAGPWHANARKGRLVVYAQRHLELPGRPRSTQQLHTFLTSWTFTDHINGDGLDNRRINLRAANRSQNNANCRLRADSTSGFKGVCRVPKGWRAQLRHGSRRGHIGYFSTAEDAARAYDDAARELFGEFAVVNFPRDGEQSTLRHLEGSTTP